MRAFTPRQELTNEWWTPSFGSAFNRNCRINRFTVGEQVFELPERYIFERDLGKGAYGLFPTHPWASEPLIPLSIVVSCRMRLPLCIGVCRGSLDSHAGSSGSSSNEL